MKGNKVVSVMVFPDYNAYRVQVARYTNRGYKVNTYLADYKNLKKCTSYLMHVIDLNMLVGLDLITLRRKEHGYA